MAFSKAREKLVDHLDVLGREDFLRRAHHPRLNIPMRLVDHAYFVAELRDVLLRLHKPLGGPPYNLGASESAVSGSPRRLLEDHRRGLPLASGNPATSD